MANAIHRGHALEESESENQGKERKRIEPI